ncbi:AAEL001105-PB [Aedes aegypti]|uniref:AAEL001105-PB n=1 Tax=Aedes aegypti TaxID=7159 RepID=Q17M74_AEDAE|nr:AAEL001105-PB [Aedes aegypti]
MEGDPNLKSEHAEIRSFVLFKNYTERTVDIYWVPVNTYVTHPWVFIDRLTGERMLVNGKPVYYPEPWYTNIDANGKLNRIEVRIHYPLRSLKGICTWKVFSLMQQKHNFLELDIPKTLVADLRSCYNLFLMSSKLAK